MNLKNFCVCSIILISIHVATTQTQGFQQLWTWEGKIANNQAGAFITSCDANGDGHPDLVVTSLDKVYLFTLSIHSLFSSTPDWEANLPNNHLPSVNGLSVACADFNSDGYDDLAVGVWTENDNYDIRIFNGTANSPQMDPYNLTFYSNTTAYWGYSLHPADFNNDGKKDLAVGCLGDCGVYIYHQEGSGLSDTPVTTASLTPNILTFGSAVVSADFEGDHYPDLVIGARGYNDNSGAIHIAKITSSGIQSPLAWSYAGADTLAQVGYDLATGDFNGDGFLDIVTLSPGNSRVLIFYGTGSTATFPATPSVILTTQQPCTSIRTGNINHDSYDDFVVGSYSSNEIYVYYGAAVIMNNAAPVVTINGTSGAAGWSVAVMWNLDENSTSEIAWSSWKYTNGEVNEGLVTVGYNLAASPTPSSTPSRSPSPSTSSSTSSTPSSTPSTTSSITPSSSSSVSSIPTTSSTPSVTSSSGLKSSEIAAIATVVPIGALGMLGISFAVFRKKQLKENVEMEPVDTQRVDEEKAIPTEPEENIPQKSSEETQVYESADTSSSESESEPEHISESDSSSLVSSSFSD